MKTTKVQDIVICVNDEIVARMPISQPPEKEGSLLRITQAELFTENSKNVAHELANALFDDAKAHGGWTLANKMYGNPTYSLDIAAYYIVMTFANEVHHAKSCGVDNADNLLALGWAAAHKLAAGLGKASEKLVVMFENLGVLQLI